MRPEATPGIIRAYLQNKLYSDEPIQKLYFIGEMFRAERPQKGRYRQFEQIDAEIIGNPHPAADAEVILLLDNIFKKAKVENYSIDINSLGCSKCRPVYRTKLLDFLNNSRQDLCENCQTRIDKNPLRALDCKIDKLKVSQNAPKMQLCGECLPHFETVKNLLGRANIEFNININMVRGLDYYTRTVFEFKTTKLGSQDAIAGGGRYDDLIKSMGGADTPAIGWAMGVDRVLQIIKQQTTQETPLAFVISADTKGQSDAFEIMQKLQTGGFKTQGGLFNQSLKSQMRAANKADAKFALIIGESELKNNTITIKNLETGNQEEIARDKIKEFLKNL
jgi:histidyl-tRNA synthetase